MYAQHHMKNVVVTLREKLGGCKGQSVTHEENVEGCNVIAHRIM